MKKEVAHTIVFLLLLNTIQPSLVQAVELNESKLKTEQQGESTKKESEMLEQETPFMERYGKKRPAIHTPLLLNISKHEQSDFIGEGITKASIEIVCDLIAEKISEELGTPVTHFFTSEQLEQIESFTITGNTGLNNQALQDIAKLTQLSTLRLDNNQITDITPLASLTNLNYLYLNKNAIQDIQPLAGLTKLRRLELTENKISDITALQNMKEMETLYLYKNQIQAIDILHNMPNLSLLSIHGNQIVDIQALAGLTKLTKLVLTQNKIQSIAPLENLTDLDELWLGDNQLINAEPVKELTKLRILSIYLNKLTDSTPFSNLTNLIKLDVSNNALQSVEPLSKLTKLGELYVSNNQIADIAPVKEIVTEAKNQQILLPTQEALQQLTINNVIQQVTALGTLNITADHNGNYNETTNQISWENLDESIPFPTELTYNFSFDTGNIYSGEVRIPIKKGIEAPVIQPVFSDSLKIEGSGVPQAIVQATVSGNEIGSAQVQTNGQYEIAIPVQKAGTKISVSQTLGTQVSSVAESIVQTAVSASDLGLQAWLIEEVERQLAPKKIGRSISFEDLKTIRTIVIDGANIEQPISGTIPDEISRFTELEVLIVRNTQIRGAIPATLGELTKLKNLELNNNQLTSSFPDTVTRLNQLETLDISHNTITGTIPLLIGDLVCLTHLDLSHNQFSGAIPTNIGHLRNLTQAMALNHNLLTGSIPATFSNLNQVTMIDLSNNQLSGAIPANLSNLEQLQSLNLSDNQLSGGIPTSIGDLSNLAELDLSGNRLTGKIPGSFGNLQDLTSLNVQSNQLSGAIDNILGWLAMISGTVDIHDNQLTINREQMPQIKANNQNWSENFIQDNQANSYQLTSIEQVRPLDNQLYLFDPEQGRAFPDIHGKALDEHRIGLWPEHTYTVLNEQCHEVYTGPADPSVSLTLDGSKSYTVILDSAKKNPYAKTTFTIDEGTLSFSLVPAQLTFENALIEQKGLIKRDSDWQLAVKDTRLETLRSPWRVDLSIKQPFTSQNHVMNNSLVIVKNGNDSIVEPNQTKTIYLKDRPTEGETIIRWNEQEGLLARIPSGSVLGNYQTTVDYTLVNGL